MSERPSSYDGVREFWGSEACGTQFVPRDLAPREFFERYRRFRYETEWHIPVLVPFSECAGKRVLEIGCGNGADGVQFARHGAEYTGVDLTEAAVAATREHFELLGLMGRFLVENAERLSFDDRSFDVVYSYGVLHHTPRPAEAFDEILRVLVPGGRAILMLYNRRSFNYYVRILLWMRARALLACAARMRRWSVDRRRLADGHGSALRGNADPRRWEVHYRNFLEQGWTYFNADHFVHHGTDGPGCPFAYVFSRAELRSMLRGFAAVTFKAVHFPLRKYLGRAAPRALERPLASALGWYLMVFATK